MALQSKLYIRVMQHLCRIHNASDANYSDSVSERSDANSLEIQGSSGRLRQKFKLKSGRERKCREKNPESVKLTSLFAGFIVESTFKLVH